MQWPRHMLPALHSRKSRSVPPPDGVCTPGLAAAATRVRNVGGSHRSTLEGKVRKEAGRPGPALAGGTQTQGASVSRKHSTAPSHSLARSNLLPRPQQPHPAHPAAMNSEQRAGRSHGERPGWQTGRLRAAAFPRSRLLGPDLRPEKPGPSPAHEQASSGGQLLPHCGPSINTTVFKTPSFMSASPQHYGGAGDTQGSGGE